MVEVTILIPVADNDGVTFSPTHHAAFEAVLLDRFGGLSRLPGTVTGQWVGDGKTFTDHLVAYVVALDGLIAKGAALREVIDFAKAHYRQEAIFCRYLGTAEVL